MSHTSAGRRARVYTHVVQGWAAGLEAGNSTLWISSSPWPFLCLGIRPEWLQRLLVCTALLLGECDQSLPILASPRRREAQPIPQTQKLDFLLSGAGKPGDCSRVWEGDSKRPANTGVCQLKVNYLLYPYIQHLVCINQQENIGEWGILMVFGVDLSFCHGAFLQDCVQPFLCTLPLPGIQGAP